MRFKLKILTRERVPEEKKRLGSTVHVPPDGLGGREGGYGGYNNYSFVRPVTAGTYANELEIKGRTTAARISRGRLLTVGRSAAVPRTRRA